CPPRRPHSSPTRRSSDLLQRRASLRETIVQGMPALEKATAKYDLDEYYDKALALVMSNRARDAFDLTQEKPETRDRYGRNTFGRSEEHTSELQSRENLVC